MGACQSSLAAALFPAATDGSEREKPPRHHSGAARQLQLGDNPAGLAKNSADVGPARDEAARIAAVDQPVAVARLPRRGDGAEGR